VKKTERILNGLGINTIGEISSMSMDALKSHFGASGELLHRYANGIDDREVKLPVAAKSIGRETTFSKDIKYCYQLEAKLRYLSERLVVSYASDASKLKA
jgi:DNA polymerase-4